MWNKLVWYHKVRTQNGLSPCELNNHYGICLQEKRKPVQFLPLHILYKLKYCFKSVKCTNWNLNVYNCDISANNDISFKLDVQITKERWNSDFISQADLQLHTTNTSINVQSCRSMRSNTLTIFIFSRLHLWNSGSPKYSLDI